MISSLTQHMQSAFQHVTPLLSKEPENEQAGHFSLLDTGLHTRPWLCLQGVEEPGPETAISSQDTSPRDSWRVPSSQHVQNRIVSPDSAGELGTLGSGWTCPSRPLPSALSKLRGLPLPPQTFSCFGRGNSRLVCLLSTSPPS